MSTTNVEDVLYRIQADAKQAIAEMERFRKAEQDSGKEVENSNRRRQEAGKSVDGFGEKLRGFAQGQRRDGMIARWYAGELASVLPVSGQMKAAFAGLTAGLVGGGGVALAIEAVSWGLKFLAEMVNEAAEAQKKAKEIAEKHATAMRDLRRETDDYIFSLAAAPGSLNFLRDKMRALSDEAEPLKKKLAEVRESIAFVIEDSPVGADAVPQRLRDEEASLLEGLARIAEKEAEVRRGFAARVAAEEDQARAEAEKKAKEAREAREKKDAETSSARRIEILRAMKAKENEIADREFIADMEREEAKARALHEREVLRIVLGDEARAKEILALEEWRAKQVAIFIDDADEKLLIEQEYQRKRAEIIAGAMTAEQRYVSQAQGAIRDMGRAAFTDFANAAVGQFGRVLTTSHRYEQAMKAAGGATQATADLSAAAFAAFAQNAIASVAQQAAIKALWELAEGTAMVALSLAGMPMQGSAAAHFKAAAMYGTVAAVAGTAAFAIGQTRGLTSAERSAVAEQEARASSEGAVGSTATAAGGVNRAGSVAASAGEAVRERVIIYVGDPFMTPAENAAAIARRLDLLERLDLRSRGG